MFKELFVVLSAKISGFIKGIKQVLGITEGARKQINSAASDMGKAFESAFSGDLRSNIANLSESISVNRDRIVALKEELKKLQSELKKQKSGTEEFKNTERAIRRVQKGIFDTTQDLAKFNIAARDQKSALASSRLAAEDNSAAIEATSRAVNAATGALLLFGEGNETLKPVLKGVGTALALVNVAIVFQNLRLRENAVFARASAGAQNLLKAAFIGTSAAGTALKTVLSSIGIGLVIVAISTLVSKMIEVSSATNKAEESQKKFNESYSKFGGSELTKVNLLIAQVNDLSLSLDTRKAALKDLQGIFPAYFKNLSDEKILSGQVRIETGKLTDAILKNAKARAIAERIGDIATETLKKEKLLATSQERLVSIQKKLNGEFENVSSSQFYALGLIRTQEAVNQLKKEIQDLTSESENYAKQIGAINQETDPIIGAAPDEPKKVKLIKEKAIKEIKQAVNEQEKLAIIEARTNEQRLLFLAETEEQRAAISNATEQEILNIRKQYFIQGLTAQGASQNKSLEAYAQYKLDVIEAEIKANKLLQDARDKDTDAREKSEIESQEATQEANLGLLAIRKELYEKLKGINAKQYNDSIISEKEFLKNQKQLIVDFLKEKITLLRAAGVDTLATEQALADALLAQTNQNNKRQEEQEKQFAKNINRVFQQAFRQLGNDIGNALNDSLNRAFQGTGEIAQIELDILREQQRQLEQTMKDAAQSDLQMLQNRKQYLENEKKLAEATESNLSTLFRSILEGVADFLQNLGIGLVAAALATDAFQTLLLKSPKAAAVAGAAAIVASAGVRAVLARGVKFADGGIVSGPTLGLVGEYPGASTNPEVIAPLNKLKSLIGNTGDGTAFIAETRISGRDLAIVFNRYNKDLQRG
jgi:hypothetical protein